MVDRSSGDYFFFFDPTSKKAVSELGMPPPPQGHSRSHQPVNRAASTLDVSRKHSSNPNPHAPSAYPAGYSSLPPPPSMYSSDPYLAKQNFRDNLRYAKEERARNLTTLSEDSQSNLSTLQKQKKSKAVEVSNKNNQKRQQEAAKQQKQFLPNKKTPVPSTDPRKLSTSSSSSGSSLQYGGQPPVAIARPDVIPEDDVTSHSFGLRSQSTDYIGVTRSEKPSNTSQFGSQSQLNWTSHNYGANKKSSDLQSNISQVSTSQSNLSRASNVEDLSLLRKKDQLAKHKNAKRQQQHAATSHDHFATSPRPRNMQVRVRANHTQ